MNKQQPADKKKTNRILQALKWIALIVLLYIGSRYINIQDIRETFQNFSILSFILYVAAISISRILYAWRWKLNGKKILNNPKIPLLYLYHANNLAEFVTIVMPSSITGEVTRVIKMNARGNKTISSTAVLMIDRFVGIASMAFISFGALLIMGRDLQIDLNNILPSRNIILITSILVILLAIGLFLAWRRFKNANLREKIIQAWGVISANSKQIVVSFFISCLAHISFSASHYFLFQEVYPLPIIDIIGVILFPQLARIIPLSVIGISPGEGMMVASQMMIGISRETAVAVTFLTLLARYVIALSGFIIELFIDGIRFFRNLNSSESIE